MLLSPYTHIIPTIVPPAHTHTHTHTHHHAHSVSPPQPLFVSDSRPTLLPQVPLTYCGDIPRIVNFIKGLWETNVPLTGMMCVRTDACVRVWMMITICACVAYFQRAYIACASAV